MAKEQAALPPFTPLVDGSVLPGGERILVLYRDGNLALINTAGKELAKLDERKFKPSRIRVSRDGRHAVAIVPLSREASSFRTELVRLDLGTVKEPKLVRDGSPRVVESDVDLDATTLAIDLLGSKAATAKRGVGDKWELEVHLLGRDEAPRKLTVKVPSHMVPQLGFVGRDRLIVSSHEGSVSWVLDLAKGESRPRVSIPQDHTHQGKVQAVGPRRQIVAYGSWLFVHDVADKKHRFLGYKATQGAAVSVSPNSKYVAWGYTQGPVVVEPVDPADKSEAVQIRLERNNGQPKVRFVDDERIVVVDSTGAIYLYAWRTGNLLAEAGVMGNIRSVQMDLANKLLLVDRHNSAAQLFEVTADGFGEVYTVADQAYRMGLLDTKSETDPLLWTLDGSNKMRQYSRKDLRSDLSREATLERGTALKNGQPAPLAVDRKGRHYGVRWTGSQLELFVERSGKTASKPVPSGDVNQIIPSPDGTRFLAVFNRAGAISAAVHETSSLTPLWSYSTGVFNTDVSWSADGSLVGMAAQTGAILLDSESGRPVRLRCGLAFTAVGAPPPNAFSNVNQRSLCEPA